MKVTETINMIIGLYGAVVATASFVIAVILGVIEYRRNQPKIKVRLDTIQELNTNPRARNNLQKNYLSINDSTAKRLGRHFP